jgi:DNA-binding response OmpR family regulator
MDEHKHDGAGQKKTVLAVDDEKEILKLYDTFLKYKGYRVKTAMNAEACLREMRHGIPDILLLDINMPEVSGLQLLEMIRSHPSGKNVPIIIISARGDEATIEQAVKLGCDNYLIKPFTMKELARRIDAELFSVDVEFVRQLLPRLQYPHQALLRAVGLKEFAPSDWDAYSFKADEIELCVLVRRGYRTAPLAKAVEEELKRKVSILYKHPMKWKCIWPGI